VTGIGRYAFSGCSSLTSINVDNNNEYYSSSGGVLFDKNQTILICYPAGKTESNYTVPNSVTTIGDSAFLDCSALTSVTIPDSVTSIREHAFYYCSSLASVTIPDSVTSIGEWAFSNCSSLKSMTIPNSVTSIGSSAFRGCSSLVSMTIPDSVTSIGISAFIDCSSLASVTIPNSVTSIGDYAFSGCSSLTSVTIPNSVTSIGSSAFRGCSSLASVTIPNSVTSIDSWAFADCSALTSVTIPDSVTSIGSSAFRGCSSLASVTIPNSVTSIGSSAFRGCSSLASVTIPNSVTSIAERAFEDCSSLASMTIPDSVTSVGDYAFYNCSSLASVTIPDSVTSIREYTFYGCSSLASVTIPNSVSSIGDYAFESCSSLASVTIPDSVTSIGKRAFYNCSSLKSVTIPNSVTSIGSCAFSGYNKLKDVAFGGTKEEWEATGYTFDSYVRMHYSCKSLDGHYVPVEVKEPNCQSTGYIKYICSCGNEYTETLPKSHDFVISKTVAPTCSEHGYDLLKCSKCGEEKKEYHDDELLQHSYVVSAVEPSCLVGGYKLHKCSVCGYSYKDELVQPLGHSETNAEAKAPTCTEAGHTAGTCCSRCGKIMSGMAEIAALGHSFGEWTVTTAPTCTEKGVETRYCSRCDATETREVDALGHALVHHDGKAATCTEAGWEAYDTCSRCDYTTYKEIPATGHHHDAVVTAPTCTEKGYTTHTCACGDSHVDSYTDALGHSYKNGKCVRCNAADPTYIAAPTLKITTSAGKPKISWNAVDGATKYWIYRSTDGKTFEYYDSTTKTSYTNKSTSIGTTYYYKVKAAKVVNGKNVNSVYSNVKSVKCVPAAPVLKITTSAGKPKISWNAVDGATKYWIYRSTDGKTFKYYDSTTKTSYTNKSTSIGTTYYYKVKAVTTVDGTNYTSDLSGAKSILCKPAAPTVSIYRTNGKPQLKWSAVTGATKYWIYRSTDGKTFKYYDSTTKTSYTNSGAASGKKYYYRVKAVAVVNGTNVTSANSNIKSLMTTLAKPTVSITTSNGKPRITWKAVTGADKYYLYRSTDGKNFSYYDSTTKLSYTNAAAKKNTKYYYKIKAVCASNSYANSAYSTVVSIKATK